MTWHHNKWTSTQILAVSLVLTPFRLFKVGNIFHTKVKTVNGKSHRVDYASFSPRRNVNRQRVVMTCGHWEVELLQRAPQTLKGYFQSCLL